MLPKEFNLNEIDEGIRSLVITLNRIPKVNEKTTVYGPTSCEGHVWNNYSKDGWIYFYKPMLKEKKLIKTIEQFCKEKTYFGLESSQMRAYDFEMVGLNSNQSEIFGFYKLEGRFDNSIIANQKEEWKDRMNARKKELLLGWNELDSRIKNYIIENITEDIESLPYMSNEEGAKPVINCPNYSHPNLLFGS